MMLKTLVRRFLLVGLVLLAGLVFGCFIGYEYAYWGNIYPSKNRNAERNNAFYHRLEAIEFSLPCEDLNRVGLSGPMKKDGIIYYVNVQDKSYQVIGLSTDSEGPLISWSGADRQPCEEPASSNLSFKRDAPKRAP
jgi:hypothetical protein